MIIINQQVHGFKFKDVEKSPRTAPVGSFAGALYSPRAIFKREALQHPVSQLTITNNIQFHNFRLFYYSHNTYYYKFQDSFVRMFRFYRL